MENKNLKIKMTCYDSKIIVESSDVVLSFTATLSNSKKAIFKFKNDEPETRLKGSSDLCIFDMETVEKNKKFITTFTLNYYCSSYCTMSLNVETHGKIYKFEATQRRCDNECRFITSDNGESWVKFKNHEHLTQYYKKDFKIDNPPKPKKK